MKTLTVNQRDVLEFLDCCVMPMNVREIADSNALAVSSVRAALTSLERRGAVEQRGVSMYGGTTWTLFGRAEASA